MKKNLSIIFALVLLLFSSNLVSAQSVQDLNNKINELQQKVSDLKSQGDSLSSQIGAMDNQMTLSQYRISSTQKEITDITLDIDSAGKRMSNLEGSLNNVTKVLLNRIVATYQAGNANQAQILLNSSDITDMISRANYLRLVQQHDKELLYETQQARNDYSNQKQILENKKKKIEELNTQLEQYTKDLDSQKASKQQLLTQTQGSEATYEQLLAQTKAQLASFSRFTTSQGGASLLGNQTSCDDWGCYYNQRDAQWGGANLNGQSGYSVAEIGCLMTAMSMVYTHYGHRDVTPLSINSVGSNFSGIPSVLLKFTISANGVSASRANASIDSVLSSGNPVIVGISYDAGPYPDHFVVLRSGSNGNYQMNDPFTPNGRDIPFTSKYSLGSIREIDRVSI
ncbi:MAG: PcsB-like coiled-coil domain-containing protein [Candidatus Levyibacteriota bacterium]